MIDEDIRQTKFRFIGPNVPVPNAARLWLFRRPHIRHTLERSNTIVPRSLKPHLRYVQQLNTLRYMSTQAIGTLINKLVSDMPSDQLYLNIGVWRGYTLFSGMIGNSDKQCIGVDNFSQFGNPRDAFMKDFQRLKSEKHLFYELDFRDYLRKKHTDPIGVYFYDGNHSEKDQYDALVLAEQFFAPGCTIIVDDTNWPEPRNATGRFLQEREGQYRILADVRTVHDNHPTYWNGLMIVQKQ